MKTSNFLFNIELPVHSIYIIVILVPHIDLGVTTFAEN